MPLYEFDGKRPTVPESAWIAPSADLIGDVVLGEKASVWFGAVIRGDNTPIAIGARTNVQEGAVMHSDAGVPLTIGADVTVGHQAMLHGCTIGDHVLVGMGATVLNGAVIGDGCLIGAGALVTEGKEFPPRSLIVGSPAKAIRTLDEATVERLKRSAASYVEKAGQFRTKLRRMD
jgi:carbonic anhydrase/acetyltransferase-like protein (isoleucine patch superfamily)